MSVIRTFTERGMPMHRDRRTFLKMLGTPALAAALPLDLTQALEIPAHNRSGTIADVEHIICTESGSQRSNGGRTEGVRPARYAGGDRHGSMETQTC